MPPGGMSRAEKAARDRCILNEYLTGGYTETELGERWNCSQQTVSRAIRSAMECMTPAQIEKTRARAFSTLTALMEKHTDRALADAPPAFNGKGEILRDENDEIVRNYGGSISHTKAVTDLITTLSRLLGLDAPSKAEVSTELRVTLQGVDIDDV